MIMSMIYFVPGERVHIKQDLMFKPQMVVKDIKKSRIKNEEGKTQLQGISCFWFTNIGEYQEAIFNSKDLEKLDKE